MRFHEFMAGSKADGVTLKAGVRQDVVSAFEQGMFVSAEFVGGLRWNGDIASAVNVNIFEDYVSCVAIFSDASDYMSRVERELDRHGLLCETGVSNTDIGNDTALFAFHRSEDEDRYSVFEEISDCFATIFGTRTMIIKDHREKQLNGEFYKHWESVEEAIAV